MKERQLALGEEYSTGDFVIVTIRHRFEDRLRSYEQMAEAFGLKGEVPSATPDASVTPSTSLAHALGDVLGNAPRL